MVAAVLAGTLVVIAVVLALLLPGQTAAPPGPPAPALPSQSASESPGVSPSSPERPSSPGQQATDTPEAGQIPVEPPVIVPPVTLPPTEAQPQPAPPEPDAPPQAPFPVSLRGQDLTVIPGAGRVVALTFDAGANAAGLPKILSALAAKGVAATFFLTGNWTANNPQAVPQIVAAGHRVANHSMTHPGFTGLGDDGIRQQVRGAEQAILAAGADPRPLFRFPYGERDARTIAAVNSLGYVAVRWTVDTLGWKGTSGGASVQAVADRVQAGLQPGEIVLMHIGSNPDDGTTLDADALPQVIDRIFAAGYGFTTLDALPAQ